jgi:TrpR-related protein YerC/YecD
MSVDKLRTPDVERLLAAFMALETMDEMYAFLLDVATVREIHDLAQRLAVARLLDAGEPLGYRAVLDASGVPDDERPGE